MIKSIQQFCENDTINIEKLSSNFFENPTDMASLVNGIKDIVINLGCKILGEVYDELDESIRQSKHRKANWEIVRRDDKSLLTSLGNISFKKTLYKNKQTGVRTYLLDKYLEIEENTRISEDGLAKLLEEAVETSYSRAGNAVSLTDSVSKSTVKNKIHELEFPEVKKCEEKTERKYLYVEADEDHISIQKDENGKHDAMTKLVYVHEGIECESPKGKRYKLINPHYFSGIYTGDDNEQLWEEVSKYVENTYEVGSIERIYLNSDGGNWIKGGKNKIGGLISVLDEYHLNKYVTKMTSHLFDSAEDGRNMIIDAIKNGTKEDFEKVLEPIINFAEEENVVKRINEGKKYIKSNWMAAKLRLRGKEGVIGSSTEGHVSHILASRMSSRPMGWSLTGADKMSKLRAYSWNGGDMLELVRYQKNPEVKNTGYVVFSSSEMTVLENKLKKNDDKYYDKLQHSISEQAKKILAINERVRLM